MAVAAACGDSPTQPSPPVDPGAPTITCPSAPASVQATDSSGAVVTYGLATVALGSTPLTGPTCNPPSGSKFPAGSTAVTCTVSDAKARPASCTFNVVVQPPPKLSLTRFLAFGDSITAGEIVGEGIVVQGIGVIRPLLVDPFLAYPADLTRNLAIRYSSQQPFVENVGRPGETTAQGVVRLPTELSAANAPQVLLLLEGANDIGNGDPATVNPGVQDMDAMVRIGKSRGLRVFVGTLPPQNPNACTGANVPAGCVFRAGGAGNVVPFNNGLKAMAAVENVPLVDVYTAFHGDVTTLIDFDGLHPTANGYQVIANAFSDAIKQNLETAATTTVFTRPSFVRPGRR
jgi:lysophospholipase L1-like esterase